MYKNKSVKNAVLELQNSYQKYFEENKERICETDYTDETFETEKITLVSNPIHTGSKEPVVWYQLGELMKNAKERVKIHTPYIICNDMMYNTWKEINKQLEEGMMESVRETYFWYSICLDGQDICSDKGGRRSCFKY